jgi:homoserine dehydrogenase
MENCDKCAKSEKVVKVGLIGLGTVGGGTLEVLAKNSRLIEERSVRIEVSRVCNLNVAYTEKRIAELGLTNTTATDDYKELIADPEIDIVIELIGGIHPALEMVSGALRAGKSVVTANKDLVASHGAELFKLAEENQVDFFFEASVAGGIPILKALKDSLAANNINQIMGIVNGTTNYILSQMTSNGVDFQPCLKRAQELGYAEADPTNDIEGFDAARKMAILASIAFNSNITEDMVYVEGITKISKFDIAYAAQLGYIIKLVGHAKPSLVSENKVEVCVYPMLLPNSHPLASVNDVFNAVFVEGDALGQSMFYGRGAGSLPTASAVAGDVITAAKKIVNNTRGVSGIRFFENKQVVPIAECCNKYYIRLMVQDKPKVLAQIAEAFANSEISLDSVIQKRVMDSGLAEIVLITHQVKEANLQEAIARLNKLSCVDCVASMIRVNGN